MHAQFTLSVLRRKATDYAVTFSTSDGQKTAVSAVLDTLIDTARRRLQRDDHGRQRPRGLAGRDLQLRLRRTGREA